MSDTEGRRKHLIPRRQRDLRRRAWMYGYYDDHQPSIASLVERAVRDGIPDPEPLRLHGLAAAAVRDRNWRILRERNPADDSGYDDYFISDHIWNTRYKHEQKDHDQHIFNVLRQDIIPQQKRKVNVTTATMVRVGDEAGSIYRMWRKHVKPTISKAPRKKKIADKEKAKRDAALHKILGEAAQDMRDFSGGSDNELVSDYDERGHESRSTDSQATTDEES